VVLAFNIEQGHYGNVPLDGLNFVMALTTPGVMREGNSTEVLYIDERANPQQREALAAITSGQEGTRLPPLAKPFPSLTFWE
jgi:hypothetical protein